MNIKWKEEMHMDGHPEIFSGPLHAKFLGVPLHYDQARLCTVGDYYPHISYAHF